MSEEEATSEETTQTDTLMTETPAPEGWNLSDTVKGEGDIPDYFKADKYKTISAQAKAYTDLEKRFGGFTGAPEAYEVNLSEEISDKGFKFKDDSPVLEAAKEWAKSQNLNQEGFNGLTNLAAELELSGQIADEEYLKTQIEELGGDERVLALQKMGESKLPEEFHEGFRAMFRTAESIKAGEYLFNELLGGKMNPDESSTAGVYTQADVEKLQFEIDEVSGQRAINVSPEKRAIYDKMRKSVYGMNPHIENRG